MASDPPHDVILFYIRSPSASDEAHGHLLLPRVAALLRRAIDEARGHPLLPQVIASLRSGLLLPCRVVGLFFCFLHQESETCPKLARIQFQCKKRRARMRVSDFNVMRDVMLETRPMCVSLISLCASPLNVSYVVAAQLPPPSLLVGRRRPGLNGVKIWGRRSRA
jgi:hypothetical protein